jgi:drug/metabolite transporter (DMT)-like permease
MLCALAASGCYNLAPALQKEGLSSLPPLGRQPLHRQLFLVFGCRRWLAGFGLGLFGFLPFAAALRLAGVAVVQPVMGLGLVVLVLYGYRRLGERLSPRGLAGIGLLLALPALIAAAGVRPPLVSLEAHPARLALALGLAAVLLLSLPLGLASRRLPLLLAVPVGLLYCLLAVCLQGAMGLLDSAGPLRGPLARSAAQLLRDPRVWGAGALLLMGLGTNIGGYYLAQIGLQRNAATRFNPLMNATAILAGTSLGLFVYAQPVSRPAVYLLAMGFAVAGMVLLSGRGGH